MQGNRGDSAPRSASGANAPFAAAVLLCAALALCATLSLGASSALALPAKRVCAAPAPGRAACMAERLLLGAGTAESAPPAPPGAAGTITANKPYAGYLTPQLLHEAYALPSETPEAAGQTIALIDAFDDPTAEADLAVFDAQFGLPACTAANGCFKKLNESGAGAPLPAEEGGWASEISIDVQMAHAICTGCHILLVEANSEEFTDLGAAVDAAVKAGATVISNSYGGPEEGEDRTLGSADYTHPGTVLVASSGDCGYLNESCSYFAKAANFPADSPAVVAVGGTALKSTGGAWQSSAWSEGGSGCSTIFDAGLWQSDVANFAASGCGAGRAVADVAAIGDPNTGVNIYDSTPEEPGAKTGWGVWGGTSVAAPIVAAEFALAGGSHGVSSPAATLYSHVGEASALYDVTAGNDGSCAGATICTAAPGYDGPTGVGSPLGLQAFAPSGSPESTSPPQISGTPEEGQTLSESHGDWTGSPSSYGYQWERCGAGGNGCLAIAGATAQSYLLGSADVAGTIRVRETARNASGANGAESAVSAPIASDVPAIESFTPVSGITGSKVTITGSALGDTSKLVLGKLAASFVVLSAGKLEATVPNGDGSGKLTVTTPHASATAKGKFFVTFAVKSLAPSAGAPGTLVKIKGAGFNSSSKVSFAGTPATTTFKSSTKLEATVPPGATSGYVTVTNTSGTAGTVSSAATFKP